MVNLFITVQLISFIQYIYIYIYIYTRTGSKVNKLIKIHSWNVTKFFNLEFYTFLLSVLQCLYPIGKNGHQQKKWRLTSTWDCVVKTITSHPKPHSDSLILVAFQLVWGYFMSRGLKIALIIRSHLYFYVVVFKEFFCFFLTVLHIMNNFKQVCLIHR